MTAIDSMCLFIHRTAVIMADGEVVTCANMFAEHVGHLEESPDFISIWNGSRLSSVRKCLNGPDEWKQCRTCWFREIRYHSQRKDFAKRDHHALDEATIYKDASWDFRRYRDPE